MNKWLQNFAVKTGLSWWIFALAGFIILMISIVTISFEIRKASRNNPADIMKYE